MRSLMSDLFLESTQGNESGEMAIIKLVQILAQKEIKERVLLKRLQEDIVEWLYFDSLKRKRM